ncbi:MAG TPA: AAA family ATPase, partial [Candidatus Binatia bacterium]|nr:AAA family ATPase [Candidatus Binatia bacterium]
KVMRQKLAGMVEDLPPEIADRAIHVFELLLAIAARSEQPKAFWDASQSLPRAPRLEGQALTYELFEVMLKLLRDLGDNERGVMVFDDLQWADEASAALLLHLFQLAEQTALLFLCALRPYRQSPAWKIKTAESDYPNHYTEISLSPLSVESSHLLVDSLLQVADLPSEVHKLILQKAEGNPFFVEEIVRTLIEEGFVVRDRHGVRWKSGVEAEDLAIPGNVQALLAARIDRLGAEVRQTLQLASVIGRSFYRRVLQRAIEGKASLDEHLLALERAELIRVVAVAPELEYAFRHELTRDVAYQSILRRHRRRFHLRVGKALERLYPERLEELAPRLAYHFYEGRDDERALRYYIMAGDAAARLYANAEAARHYGRALEVALRSQASNEQLIDLHSSRGRVLELLGHYDDALANYQELEALGRERAGRSLELAALVPQATIHSTPTVKRDPKRALALSERALSLARELNDPRAEAKSLWNLMLLETYVDHDPQRAVAYGEQSLAIAREHHLGEELAYTLNDIARPYAAVGKLSRAQAALEEARALWRELGNLPMLADNLDTAAGGCYFLGEFEEALELARESLKVSQSTGSLWGQAHNLYTIGPLYLERGEVGRGIKALEDGLLLAEQAGFAAAQVANRARLAAIYGFLGDVKRGFDLAHLALGRAGELHQPRHPALAALAQLHLYSGNLTEANADLKEAQSEFDRDDLYDLLASSIVYVEGQVALANGEHDRALGLANKTIESMRAT